MLLKVNYSKYLECAIKNNFSDGKCFFVGFKMFGFLSYGGSHLITTKDNVLYITPIKMKTLLNFEKCIKINFADIENIVCKGDGFFSVIKLVITLKNGKKLKYSSKHDEDKVDGKKICAQVEEFKKLNNNQ